VLAGPGARRGSRSTRPCAAEGRSVFALAFALAGARPGASLPDALPGAGIRAAWRLPVLACHGLAPLSLSLLARRLERRLELGDELPGVGGALAAGLELDVAPVVLERPVQVAGQAKHLPRVVEER